MNYRFLSTLTCLILILASCSDDSCTAPDCDYRIEYVGTYSGTKSNNSFEDDTFITDVEVVVELHASNDSLLIVNGLEVPISGEGNFGPEAFDGNFFDLTFDDGSIKLLTYPIVPGLAISCYIKGDKQ